MSDRLTTAIARLDPDMVADALERFVTINPHYRGANWDDVVDELLNADAHLSLTESAGSFDEAIEAITRQYAPSGRVQEPIPKDDHGFICSHDDMCRKTAVVKLVNPLAPFWDGYATCDTHRPR